MTINIDKKDIYNYRDKVFIYGIDDLTKGLFAFFINELQIKVNGFILKEGQESLVNGIYLGSKLFELDDVKKKDILLYTTDQEDLDIEGKVIKLTLSSEDEAFLKSHSKIALPYKRESKQRYYSSSSLLYTEQQKHGKFNILFGDKSTCLSIAARMALLGIYFQKAYSPEGFIGNIEGINFLSGDELGKITANEDYYIRVADGWEQEAKDLSKTMHILPRRFVKDKDVRSLAFREVNIDPDIGYYYDARGIGNRIMQFGHDGTRKLKIAVLGDSTSDVCLLVEKTWVEWLIEILGDKYNGELYCAAIEGYVGSQQLIKFARDVLPWQPDIVISCVRVSDFYNCSQENTFSNRYQEYLAKQNADGKNIMWSEGQKLKTQERVIMLQKSLHGMCSEFGIQHLSFLYPVLEEVLEKNLNDRVILLHDDHEEIQQNKYYEYMHSIHNMTKDCNLPWLIDVPCTFLKESHNMFLDYGHLKTEGNRIFAEYIYKILIKMCLNT